jgi:antirestriction protein ArdC
MSRRGKDRDMAEKKAGREATKERIADARRAVVEQIIADMESGGFDWIRQWARVWGQRNGATGRVYAGGNQFHLAAVARFRGFDDPRWVTFKQAKEAGWKVKKGAKSAIVEKWKLAAFTEDRENAETGEAETFVRKVPRLMGWWNVFNACEVEGIPALEDPGLVDHGDDAALVLADEFIASSRCPVREMRTDTACYRPTADIVEVPLRGQFAAGQGFLRVLLHEMTHSTMAPLGRDGGAFFGTPEYAFEELVAELGSLYTAQAAGFDCVAMASAEAGDGFYRNHVAYLQSWLRALKDDPDTLFRAASKASAAADYHMERLEAARATSTAA